MLKISPNAKVYGGKNESLVDAILTPGAIVGDGKPKNATSGNTEVPAEQIMTREQIIDEMPKFEPKSFDVRTECCTSCCCCETFVLTLDEREITYEYGLCGKGHMVVYDPKIAKIPYEKITPEAGIIRKFVCCKALKYNVHLADTGCSGGDIMPGCCGCFGSSKINEIADEINKRSKIAREFYTTKLQVEAPPITWMVMADESSWNRAKAARFVAFGVTGLVVNEVVLSS